LLLLHTLLFFFNDPPTTDIYTLSLHDALPIYLRDRPRDEGGDEVDDKHRHKHRRGETNQHAHRNLEYRQQHVEQAVIQRDSHQRDRKSTRLNSSHSQISYAVFCLKKKKKKKNK